MIRSLLLAALAVLLAVPAIGQNTVEFQFIGFFETLDPTGLTALVYSDDPEEEPVERVLGSNGLVTLQNVPVGTYRAYLAPNDRLFTRYGQAIVVSDSVGAEYWEGVVVNDVDPALGLVQGRVTVAASGNPVRFLQFSLPDGWGDAPYTTAIDGDGRFAFQAPPGSYQQSLPFSYPFPFPETEGVYSPVDATFSVAAGETVSLDLVTQVVGEGTVSGRVTDAANGAPLGNAFVGAFGADGFGYGFTYTGADGRYTLDAPENPEYVVYAQAAGADSNYVRQYYDGALSPADATLISVVDGTVTAGINFALSRPADDFSVSFQATVRSTDGTPLDAQAFIYDRAYGQDVTVPIVDGVFVFTSDNPFYAGTPMQVSFSASGYQSEFFDNSPTLDGARYFYVGTDAVSFDLGDVVLLADGEDEPGLAISGTVTSEAGGAPLAGAVVTAQRLDAPGIRYGVADAAGAYHIGGLASGEYAVLFTEADHVPEFYPDAALWTEAERIVLTQDRGQVNGLMGGLNRPVGANKDGAPMAQPLPSGAPFVQTGTVSGTVRSADGEALMGAVVTATGADGVEAYSLADGLGRFSMTIASGEVMVTADRSRYDAQTRRVGAGGQMLLTLDASSAVSSEDTPAAASALRIYPNPTRGRITVDLGTTGAERVSVYDVLGREVIAVEPSASAETVELDAQRLAPGRYIVRVLGGDHAESRPLTVVR